MTGSHDRCDDVAAILTPYPERAAGTDANDYEVVFAEAHEERVALAEQLRTASDNEGQDPVLRALRDVHNRLAEAERDRRRLLAYARSFIQPRPYPLRDLSSAVGLSPSSVRTAYALDDIDAVAYLVGRRPAPSPPGEDD